MADARMADEFFEELAPFLPTRKPVGSRDGRPSAPNRIVVKVIWLVLVAGCCWEDVPLELGCPGIRGATSRDSLEHPAPIEPGRVEKHAISLWKTSRLFKAGHGIRVEVSSGNVPRYTRNQNTGAPFGTLAEVRVAEQTIYTMPIGHHG